METFMSTRTINGVMLVLLEGNIVEVEADAIVNSQFGPGRWWGVDGAIHRAGGPSIMEECATERVSHRKCSCHRSGQTQGEIHLPRRWPNLSAAR